MMKIKMINNVFFIMVHARKKGGLELYIPLLYLEIKYFITIFVNIIFSVNYIYLFIN